ncbi:hypothetical protein INR49_002092 [Caranx melampygus]|nr:hypothetical protein INR49_002092 [Caranx melampygus]
MDIKKQSSASVCHVKHEHTACDGKDKPMGVSQNWSEGRSAGAMLCVFLGEGSGGELTVHSYNSSSLLKSAGDSFSDSTVVHPRVYLHSNTDSHL